MEERSRERESRWSGAVGMLVGKGGSLGKVEMLLSDVLIIVSVAMVYVRESIQDIKCSNRVRVRKKFEDIP